MDDADGTLGMRESSPKSQSMMSSELAEWIFVCTLNDLEQRARSTDAYERIGIAHLVRRLLMDSSPVLHSARRRLRLPMPTFSFSSHDPTTRSVDQGELYLAHGLSEPETHGGLEEFLAASVGEFGANPISVRELVRHVAHVEGGVHLGSPSSPLEWYLRHLLGAHPEAQTLLFDLLAEVALVVVRSLTPMRERLAAAEQ